MTKIGPDEFQRVFQLAGGQLARTEYLIKEQANMSPDQLRQLIDGQQQKVLQQARSKGLGHWGTISLDVKQGQSQAEAAVERIPEREVGSAVSPHTMASSVDFEDRGRNCRPTRSPGPSG